MQLQFLGYSEVKERETGSSYHYGSLEDCISRLDRGSHKVSITIPAFDTATENRQVRLFAYNSPAYKEVLASGGLESYTAKNGL